MKKEMIVSILVGLIFGLIITYGVYTARTALFGRPATPSSLATPQPSANPEATGSLVILSPEDESIVDTNTITVAGSTFPSAYVVVFVNNTEKITTANETGQFSTEATLENGSNVITVTVLSEDGTSTTLERTVIYSTIPLMDADLPEPSPSVSPSPSANPNRTR